MSGLGWWRTCPVDGTDHYPRTDPAVIMLLRDDEDNALLGRQGPLAGGAFSTLAGFVEPGESAEAAVGREVHEEVGLTVGSTSYLGSQPWPFPASLMLGFHARVAGVRPAPRADGEEIAEARWIARDELAGLGAGPGRPAPRPPVDRLPPDRWLVRRADPGRLVPLVGGRGGNQGCSDSRLPRTRPPVS